MAAREDLLEPIPGDDPGGPSLRYEPVYDEVKEARREDDPNLPRREEDGPPKKADWKEVVQLTEQVISERSKDLWMAVWRAEALLNTEGFGAFRNGVDLVRSLLERFWDHLHPEIDDGDLDFRAAPIEWLAQLDLSLRQVPLTAEGHGFLAYREARSMPTDGEAQEDDSKRKKRETAIAEGDLTPEDFEAAFAATPKAWYKALAADLQGSLDAIAELERTSDEQFGDIAPSFRVVRGALEDVQRAGNQLLGRKLELDPDPVEAASIMDAVDGASGTSAPASGGGAAGPPTNRSQADARVAEAAQFFRSQKPTDPGPYLMLRGLRWGELRSGHGALDPRMLAAPPTAIRTRLKTLLLDQEWPELLEGAEGVMASEYGRGWLDLQRYALTACQGLGSEYDAVADAIRGALAALLKDVPTLPESTLMDDTPAANRETRAWLRDQGLFADFSDEAEGELASRPTDTPLDAPREPLLRVVDRARRRARAGATKQAIETLMDAADREQSGRGRFLLRSHATEIMVSSGLEQVAWPLLQDLAGRIAEHGLDTWEDGETIARPLGLLYRCAERLGHASVTLGEASLSVEDLYLRICRLDPMLAIEFGRSAGASGPEAEADPPPASDDA